MLLPDTAGTRLIVHAWSAYAEDLALGWAREPAGVSRAEVVRALSSPLPALVAAVGCAAPPTHWIADGLSGRVVPGSRRTPRPAKGVGRGESGARCKRPQ